MIRYAIGDIQGHYNGLMTLLEKLGHFDELWFVGDLVNRGPHSLEVLRFLKNLKPEPKIVLGNHDLYLLYLVYAKSPKRGKDNLDSLLKAPDKDELCDWLRTRDWLIEDAEKKLIMTHAGLAPIWTIAQAKNLASELKTMMQTDNYHHFFNHYFDKRPSMWGDNLVELNRWQVASDYFTRMRFTDAYGQLDWRDNGEMTQAPKDAYPWFACPIRQTWEETIIFGHWAALMGKTGLTKFQAIDTGYNWNGHLTALNLDTFERVRI